MKKVATFAWTVIRTVTVSYLTLASLFFLSATVPVLHAQAMTYLGRLAFAGADTLLWIGGWTIVCVLTAVVAAVLTLVMQLV